MEAEAEAEGGGDMEAAYVNSIRLKYSLTFWWINRVNGMHSSKVCLKLSDLGFQWLIYVFKDSASAVYSTFQ